MQIEVIDVGVVNSHSAKNGRQYQSVEVTYKNEAGQAGNKKLMSFSHPDVFKAAQGWTKGDSVNIDSVKDDKARAKKNASPPASKSSPKATTLVPQAKVHSAVYSRERVDEIQLRC